VPLESLRRKLLHCVTYLLFGLIFTALNAFSSPATFVTALPVARDQLLVRFNAQPTFATRSFSGVQFPINVGYGLTSRWALFANVNQGFGSLSGTMAVNKTRLDSAGAGDMAT